MGATADEIVRMSKEGASEGEIVKVLGATRHAVRTAITFEAGRQAGLEEAAKNQVEQRRAALLFTQRSVQQHVVTPTGAPRATESPAPAGESLFDEELLSRIAGAILQGKAVPEKALRDEFKVSHNAMYKLRAVAADRVQRGWTVP